MDFSFKKLSFAFVIVCFCFICTLVKLQNVSDENNKLKKKNVKLKNLIDSLDDENFVKDVRLFRYERAVEIFEERNPKATSELNDIISDETE